MTRPRLTFQLISIHERESQSIHPCIPITRLGQLVGEANGPRGFPVRTKCVCRRQRELSLTGGAIFEVLQLEPNFGVHAEALEQCNALERTVDRRRGRKLVGGTRRRPLFLAETSRARLSVV